mmetsp:Transcript_17214/g.32148  ORF Transcript_17214/g.32148 Transcript_17214/m.32148 type:complete len:356 (+) Transcript_17214:164-1231(+)
MSFLKNTGKAFADIIPGLGHFTYDNDCGKIFVTSGTGVIGYRVAVSLLEAGHRNVRVGIWKGDRPGLDTGAHGDSFGHKCAELLIARGAEVVNFDWKNPDEYDKALQDVKTVFCSLPHIDGWSDVFPAFLTACKKHKVEHFVKISFLRATHNFKGVAEIANQYRQNVPFVKFHGTCDDLLELAKQDSRISYTILATSHLMTSTLLNQGDHLRKENNFVTASYGMGVNYVSPNDVADAAVVVLLNQKPHRNKVYNLTASGPIKDAEVAAELTKVYGKPIEHAELGYHEYVADVKQRGLPHFMARDAAAMERMKAMGLDENVNSYTDDLPKLIGKEPETIAGYLSHKSAMRPGMTFP